MKPVEQKFSFHFEGKVADRHSLPVSVLVQVMENAQNVVELLGCHVEGIEFRQRVKIPTRVSRRYQLECHIPIEGSYALPISLGDTTSDVFATDNGLKVWASFVDLIKNVIQRDSGAIRQLLPDSLLRRKILEYIKGMSPGAGADWRFSVVDIDGNSLGHFDDQTLPFVQSVLVPPEQREAEKTITGELKSIDFTQRQFTIVYPPTNHELKCSYDEAVENLLYENRRSLIQVTGMVVFNDRDEPKEIHSVSDINNLDLTPFTIGLVRHGDRILKTRNSLVIEPTLDDDKQYICLSLEDLGIDVFAHTRERLAEEFAEQLAMLWDEYAMEADECLDPSALSLKSALLAAFEEVVTDAP